MDDFPIVIVGKTFCNGIKGREHFFENSESKNTHKIDCEKIFLKQLINDKEENMLDV